MKGTSYVIIPAVVRYDKRLPLGARLIYGEISGLSKVQGFCFATNGYFARAYGVTTITISNWIAKLKSCGYINISYNPHRRIFVNKLDDDDAEKKGTNT